MATKLGSRLRSNAARCSTGSMRSPGAVSSSEGIGGSSICHGARGEATPRRARRGSGGRRPNVRQTLGRRIQRTIGFTRRGSTSNFKRRRRAALSFGGPLGGGGVDGCPLRGADQLRHDVVDDGQRERDEDEG